MTQKLENISALMDGEELGENSLDSVLHDTDAKAAWERYHLVRDGLRKELPTELNFDISANVAKALEQESAIVAPKPVKEVHVPFFGNVIPLVRQAGQFAVAASVAAVMIIGVQQVNQQQPAEPFSTAPVPQIPGIQGGLSPVSLEQTRAVPRNEVMEQRRRVNAYIKDHQQQLRLKSQSDASSEDKAKEAESAK